MSIEPLHSLAEKPAAGVSASVECIRDADFMARGYDLIGEPLNLHAGQAWFGRVFGQTGGVTDGCGLVLGATAWMARLLHQTKARVVLADMSARMLRMAASELAETSKPGSSFEFVHIDWRGLPRTVGEFAAVVGDNSLSFLGYPDEWDAMLDLLAERMCVGGRLVTRMLAVPRVHKRQTVEDIVAQFIAADSVNYTQVRAALLFAHLDPQTFAIPVEDVLVDYEANKSAFDALLARFGAPPDNDLVTVSKYRGSGAVYYAPPLDNILQLFHRRFRVDSVHFGPYQMAEYFPLVVAERR